MHRIVLHCSIENAAYAKRRRPGEWVNFRPDHQVRVAYMSEGRSEVYQGDAALAGLLKARKAHVDLPALKSMIGGVIATPAGDRADDWIALVAPDADEAVKT